MRNKRLAGSQLVLEPIGDISGDLRKALDNLKQSHAGNPVDTSAPRSQEYPRIDERFEVDGHQVELHANPTGIQWDPEAVIDGKVIGNQQEMRELMGNPPEVEYGMTWSVDGNYNDYGRDMPQGTRLKIAREAQRRWGQAFKSLPENAIVANSPVGASGGDYGRADLYMASGFGPVQHNGNQFGIVRGGEIQPLSPFIADQRHVSHLAKRARMAGDVDLEQAMLQANRANADINPYEGNISNAKSGYGYDDSYDMDDDYIPPVTRREAEDAIRREKERGNGVPEIAMRQVVNDEQMNRGLAFEVGADDVQAMRDAQIAALQSDAPFRGVADALQEVNPRPLPQRITERDLGRRSSRRDGIPDRVYSLRDLDRVEPGERRDAINGLIRREVDDRVQGRTSSDEQYLGGRNDIKGMMVEPVEYGNDYMMQELYSTQDVADARRMQEALAIAGEMRGQEGGVRRRRGGYQGSEVADGQGKAGNDYGPEFNQTSVMNMPQLSPEQQASVGRINEYFEARRNAPATQSELLGILDDRFASSGPAGPVFQNMYEATGRADLTNGFTVDPNMSREQAENLLRMSVEQPGRTSRDELAQAVVNLQDSSQPEFVSDEIVRQMLDIEDVGIAAGRGVGGQLSGTAMVSQPLTRLEDPRLQRPNIPVREMQLRRENQRREGNIQQANATNPADYEDAPAGMSFNEFQQWERSRRPAGEQRVLVADEAVADAVGEGLFSRSLAQPANYALAVERAERPAPRRRPRRPQSNRMEGLLNDFEEARSAPPLF